jgi:hypothetical protein
MIIVKKEESSTESTAMIIKIKKYIYVNEN